MLSAVIDKRVRYHDGFFARKRPDVLPKDILMQVTQKKTREKLSETNWKWEKITTF